MTAFDASQVYMPAEDTFLLAAAAAAVVRPTDRVIEIGTGSGYVAAAVQKMAPMTIGVDINPHAVLYAHEVNGVDAVRSDLFAAVSGTFDLILFNAPYLPTLPEERVDDWLEYALSGGESGREVIERFLPQAVLHLADEGKILLLISSLTGLDEVKEMCRALGCSAEVAAEEMEEDGEMLYVLKIWREHY